jgi:hypothetical protein
MRALCWPLVSATRFHNSDLYIFLLGYCTFHLHACYGFPPAALGPGVLSASNRNQYRKHKKKKFLGSKVRLVRGADDLTAICEPIV